MQGPPRAGRYPVKKAAASHAPRVFPPDVLAYTNYREYLRDFITFQKSVNRRFSLREFAFRSGISSHSYLKYILDGKRNISKKTLLKLSRVLDLAGAQADYFEKLVFFNQAETLEEKNHYYQKLLRYSRFKKLEDSQLQLYDEWFHVVIREMVAMKGFRKNPEWIANQLIPGIEARQAEQSLKLLMDRGLLIRTANGFQQTDEVISTDDEVQSIAVKRFHTHMIGLALQSLNQLPAAQRDISSVTFPILAEDFPKVKKHLQFLRKELRGFAAEGNSDTIIQVNLQLFPLTRRM